MCISHDGDGQISDWVTISQESASAFVELKKANVDASLVDGAQVHVHPGVPSRH
jgi:hypothetical protein